MRSERGLDGRLVGRIRLCLKYMLRSDGLRGGLFEFGLRMRRSGMGCLLSRRSW